MDDVGGISWSSLGANIWPTDAEVADGRYGLHGDDSGTDLKNDPHQVYTNSPSATYNDSIAFWFAVKAKNRLGNLSALSDPLRVILPGASGSLAVDESWAGHVRVSGDVTVPAGLTLTIAPGSVVQFSAGDDRSAGESTTRSEILVHGTLDAEGATFSTADAGSKWGGLVLSGDRSSDTRTLLTGNTIEHAATGVRLKTSGWTLGGAAAEDGNVIRDCDIGIVLESSEAASRNVVRNNTVADCARGVFVKQGVADTVRQNLITGSQAYGLQVWGRDTQVVNNTLHSTQRVGVWFGGRSSGTVRSTIASGFPAGGVVNEGTGAVTVDYYLGHDTGTDDLKGTTAGTRRALLFSDPAFTDTAAGDFTLQSGSPALDLGAPGATGLAASDGDRIDLGRYGGTAQAGEAPGRLEIEDYFYNGQISGDWTAAEGTWSGDATQGTYEAAAQTTGSSRAHQTLDAAHYRLETRLQGAEGQVLYAKADRSDSLRVHLSASQDSVRLFTRDGRGGERIHSRAYALEDDEWYSVRVAVADEQVSVSVNDSLLHDQVSTHVPADGAVGVGSYGDGSPAASFDYFLAMHVSGPGRPQGLTATPGGRQVDLRWTAAADHGTAITGYQHRHRAAGGTWSTWAATSTTTSHTVTGLRSDTRYALQVRPVSGGVSGVSAQTTAQTTVAQLTVSFGAATYQATEAGAAVSVRVGVSPAADRPVDLPITVTAASGPESGDYTVTGLSQQSTLSFVKGSTSASLAVTALEDADGDDEQVSLGFGSPLPNRVLAGTPSSATVTLEDSLAVPDAPGNLAAAAGDRQVRLSWETPDSNGARITGYSLQDSIDRGRWSTWSAIEGSDRATTSHTVRSLLNDTLYTFRVLASNRMGDGPASNRASATPKAPVITPPQPCTVSLAGSGSVSFAENRTDSVDTYTATASNCGTLTWSRTGPDSSAFRLSGSGSSRDLHFKSTPNYEQPSDAGGNNVYEVGVVAAAGSPPVADTLDVTVTVTNEPDPGAVTLSPSTPRTCAHVEGRLEDEDGGINTVFSDSPPGFPYGWRWIPQTSSSSRSPAATTSTTQSYFVGNSLVGQTVRATVQYGDNASDRNTASRTSGEVAANTPRTPTGLSATPGDRQVSLSWTAPNDCGSTITGYRYWYRKTSETAWEDSGTAAGTDTSVTGLDDNQAYSFEVRAANAIGRGGAATTDATTDPPPPCTLSLSGPAAVDYAENGSDAVGQYTATYSNCGSLSWSRAGADSSAFGLSQFSVLPSASGSLQRWLHFNNSPNYEAKSAYSVTVKITSGSTSASQAVSVTIQDVNEGPVISGPASPSVAENTTPVATYSATDPENDSITWSRAGTGSSHFTISSSGALAFTSAKDYESDQTTYSVTVKASDGQLTRNKPVTVTVTDVNEPPVISGSDNVSVPENTTPVATYTATDPESDAVEWSESSTTFTIGESSGALAFASAPNYESNTTSYNVTVTATDNGEPSASSGTSVTVTVTNADDLGSVSLSTGSPYVGDQVTATLTDEDGGITGPTWSWSSVGTGVGAASVESYPYTVAVSDFGKHLKASVGYDDAHGSDKSASSSSAEPVKAHPPDPPPDLEAARGDSQVVLTWGAADGNGAPILDYSYRHRSDTGSWPGYTSISERTKTIGNLTNGTLYHFEVRARNIGAAGSASSASATPAGLPGLPQGVGTARVGTSITVDWSAAPANGSAIERYEVDELEGITWLGWTSVGTSTTYTKESVSHSQAYTFRVRAKNGVGYGSSVEVTSPPLGPGGNSAKLAVPGLAAAPDSVLAAVSAPNPFNPSTTLHFQLPEAGPVWLTIHNTTGQIVTTLVRGTDLEAGIHSRLWDGHDDRGRPAASGLYLFRLIAGPEIRVGKLALIR